MCLKHYNIEYNLAETSCLKNSTYSVQNGENSQISVEAIQAVFSLRQALKYFFSI